MARFIAQLHAARVAVAAWDVWTCPLDMLQSAHLLKDRGLVIVLCIIFVATAGRRLTGPQTE